MSPRFTAPGSPPNLTRWQHARVNTSDAVRALAQIQGWGYTFYIIVQCAAVAPHGRFVQPDSPSFWAPLANWPRVFVTSKRIKRQPREEVCRSMWSTNMTGGAANDKSAHSNKHSSLPEAELIKVVDMAALVRGPLLLCDWNLWFSREEM